MSQIRQPRLVKAADRPQNKLASEKEMCAKLRDDELRRRWLELRRAYLAFEKLVRDSYGLTPE